jgi:hypothetical protein
VAQAPERLFIALLLDENVDEKLGPALRHYGYDALTVREAGRRGRSDEEQLDYAASTGGRCCRITLPTLLDSMSAGWRRGVNIGAFC